MSRSAATLDRAAITLLLSALESPLAILSAAVLQRYPAEAARLKEARLIQLAGYELSTASIDDHSDSPVSLTWLPEQGGHGYFSEASEWVQVPNEDLACFSVDVTAFTGLLTRRLDLPSTPPVVLLPDYLSELGSAHLGKRPKRTPILFGRRLNDPLIWRGIEVALRNRPSIQRRILLTSTGSNLLPEAPSRCAVISIADLMQSGSRLEIDPDVLSLRLDRVPIRDPEQPIEIIADGKEVRFFDKTFHFPKGLRQRDIIRVLHQHYLEGELWVSSARIIDELELAPNTRIRDIFKGHVAWKRLLTERNGMCGFCFPDRK